MRQQLGDAHLDVEVAVEALDEHDEGATRVAPQGRGLDGLAGVLGPRTNQEALERDSQSGGILTSANENQPRESTFDATMKLYCRSTET